jgi:hypothetical protein
MRTAAAQQRRQILTRLKRKEVSKQLEQELTSRVYPIIVTQMAFVLAIF